MAPLSTNGIPINHTHTLVKENISSSVKHVSPAYSYSEKLQYIYTASTQSEQTSWKRELVRNEGQCMKYGFMLKMPYGGYSTTV